MKKLTIIMYYAVVGLGIVTSVVCLVLAMSDIRPTVDRQEAFMIGYCACIVAGGTVVIFNKYIARLSSK